MSQLQFITDDSGKTTHVVLPVEEYESLIEIREFDQAVASGGEIIPDELVTRLLGDESKLKVWRQYRKLTQQQLADRTKLSKEYISMLESGKRTGNIETLKKLAAALNLDLDDLS